MDEESLYWSDPEWVDLQHPPPADRYLGFEPPRAFVDAMLADKMRWAGNGEGSVLKMIANALARVVMPRLVEWEGWRDHAVGFFKRLCAHRRGVFRQVSGAIGQLQARQARGWGL